MRDPVQCAPQPIGVVGQFREISLPTPSRREIAIELIGELPSADSGREVPEVGPGLPHRLVPLIEATLRGRALVKEVGEPCRILRLQLAEDALDAGLVERHAAARSG